MTQIKQQLQQFSGLVAGLLKLTEQMSELLGKESGALQAKDPKRLNLLIAEKKQFAQGINIKTHQLNHFLATNGFKQGKEGVNTWLQALPKTLTIHTSWSKLKELTESCAKQNEINGAMVGVIQQHARRSLDILRGRSQSDTFYGADGYSKRENHSNTILTV